MKISQIQELIKLGVPEEIANEMGPKDKTGGRDLSTKTLDYWIKEVSRRTVPQSNEVYLEISKLHKKLAKEYKKLA